jgi:hypothetical protein
MNGEVSRKRKAILLFLVLLYVVSVLCVTTFGLKVANAFEEMGSRLIESAH